MAEATLYTFNYKEVAEALVRYQGLHTGFWQIYVEFGLGAANIGPGPGKDLLPAAIVPLQKVGIRKVDQENSLTVNAAKVNPKKK